MTVPSSRRRGPNRVSTALRSGITLLLGVALVATPAVTGASFAAASDAREVQRLAGASRWETAAAISADAFAPGVGRVWLATGEAFPDALTAGAAAAEDGGPVLITARGSLPPATQAELVRLRPRQVAVVGGRAAVSDSVLAAVTAAVPGAAVARVAGPDRFATGAAVAAAGFPGGADTVYVATGGTYPDALAAVPAAGADDAPLLLVTRDSVPEPTMTALEALQPSRVVVVGGTGAVSEAVIGQLRSQTAAHVERVSGADRFATAAALLDATAAATSGQVLVASGEDFPDALAGGPAAAAASTGILLTGRTVLSGSTAAAISAADPGRVVVLGGEAAVSRGVARTIAIDRSTLGLTLAGDRLGEGLLFGTPMHEALPRLTAILGPPEFDSGFEVACPVAGPERSRFLAWAGNIAVTFGPEADPRLESASVALADGRDAYGLRTPLGIGLGTRSVEVGRRYGARAEFFPSDTNPFGSFWHVEPAEGGWFRIFATGDGPDALVDSIGVNTFFCD